MFSNFPAQWSEVVLSRQYNLIRLKGLVEVLNSLGPRWVH